MNTIKSDIDRLERWFFGNSIAEKQPDVTFLLTPKSYLEPVSDATLNEEHQTNNFWPIEQLLKQYEDLEEDPYLAADRSTNIRSIIKRVLHGLPSEDLVKLLHSRLTSGSTVRGVLAKNFLLPEEHKESTALWHANVAFDLGTLSILPPEIIHQTIFRKLTINDARKVAHVSKSWFKELTSRQVWCHLSKSSNPYLSLLRKRFYSKYMKPVVAYMEDIEVVNGEGLLAYEEAHVQGLKLNGKCIIAAWNDAEGSVGRCMVRSKVLTREEINTTVSRIESYMNDGNLDLSVLIDTFKPFMQCMTNGIYRVQVTRPRDNEYCEIIEFDSTDPLEKLVCTYPYDVTIYCTQPSDLLNQQRVAYYEELIKRGKRPAILLFQNDFDKFLIDGHHKLKAYQNLEVMHEAPLITIVPTSVKITRDQEHAYIQHSHEAMAQYNYSSQHHHYD